MINDKELKCYESKEGMKVYKLPVQAFPGHVTNCYLVMDDPLTLVDAASGWDPAHKDLSECFGKLKEEFGETATLKDVGRLLITHGHVDHFGGVNFVVEESGAELGIHELDATVIRNFRERSLVSSTNLHFFLDHAGIPKDRVTALVEMNRWSKDTIHSGKVDITITEGPIAGGPLIAHHVPGHCPGQICIEIHDILLTADHVLPRITPNQSPGAITRYNGLGLYLDSLRKIRQVEGIRVGLGGHEGQMDDVYTRIDDIINFHEGRLNKTLDILKEPRTVAEVSTGLFGHQVDYNVLLAMMETAAHVEYLHERGKVVVTNIDDIEKEFNPVLIYKQP